MFKVISLKGVRRNLGGPALLTADAGALPSLPAPCLLAWLEPRRCFVAPLGLAMMIRFSPI